MVISFSYRSVALFLLVNLYYDMFKIGKIWTSGLSWSKRCCWTCSKFILVFYHQISFVVKCARKVNWNRSKNARQKSQENVLLEVVGITFVRRACIKQGKISLCSSPLRARASAVYGLCNSLKFPVRRNPLKWG